MCGIAGIFGNIEVDKFHERIKKMQESIYHRGPDAGGIKMINSRVAMAHRRLKIIDLSDSANQPMVSNSGRYTIVFNGEIYNYNEIKLKLNYDFKTKSDTEIILASLEEKGIEWFLKEANGMYAIAVYDNEQNKIYLIRDRMGVKPVFYAVNRKNNIFVFASEIKAILSSGLIESEFNELAVDNYLANRYVREPYTFFKNIYQVKSATYLEVDSNLEIKENEYWRIPKLNFEKSYDETKIIEMLDEKITEAVSRRLISDVKLGTYLSGGVDSSLLTAIASNLTNKKIDTYTIGFNEEGFNEFKYSQMVADVYNTNHHIIEMEVDNYMNKWDELIWYKDSPLGVPNEIPLAIMSKELKKDITVVLSGEGADELFGGYGKIYRAAFEYKNIDTREDFYDFFINKYEYVPRNMRDEYLNIDTSMRDEFDEVNVKEIFHKYENEEAIFRFFYESHIKSLLQRLDMTTMQTAVEGRVPFLDYKLIEFVFENIPYDLKLKWNSPECYNLSTKMNASKFSEVMDTPKYILKKVSEKYLPSEVINRKKMGFPVPLNNWFDNIEKIAETELKDAYWINSNKLEKLILQVKNSEKAGQILWMFVNIELFRKKYFLKNWIY